MNNFILNVMIVSETLASFQNVDQQKVSSLFLRRVTVTVTELVKLDKMRNKFYFLKESFQEVKEIFKIINEKHNTPEKLTLEFAGVILKVHVRYQRLILKLFIQSKQTRMKLSCLG